MEQFSHIHWVREIGEYINENDVGNIIRFALSYTLQSLRAYEDLTRFRWDE